MGFTAIFHFVFENIVLFFHLISFKEGEFIDSAKKNCFLFLHDVLSEEGGGGGVGVKEGGGG